MKIGLLEDNPELLGFMKIALEMAGHTVYPHRSSNSLLERLFIADTIPTSFPYDLVIVDLLLPGTLSGFDVINYIRQTISHEQLPIIVISAASPGQLESVSQRFPNIQVLSKPFVMKTLLRLIDTSQTGSIA